MLGVTGGTRPPSWDKLQEHPDPSALLQLIPCPSYGRSTVPLPSAGPFQGTRELSRCFPLGILSLENLPNDSENPKLNQIQQHAKALCSVFLWFRVVQQSVPALHGDGRGAGTWENKTCGWDVV